MGWRQGCELREARGAPLHPPCCPLGLTIPTRFPLQLQAMPSPPLADRESASPRLAVDDKRGKVYVSDHHGVHAIDLGPAATIQVGHWYPRRGALLGGGDESTIGWRRE
jgi:hypothetical protein